VGVTVCPLPVRDHAHHDKLIPRYLRWEILTTKLAIGLAGAFLGAVCLGKLVIFSLVEIGRQPAPRELRGKRFRH
jgi:hypothetical protein